MTSHKIKPVNDRLLVKRMKKASTKGGILLPDSAQEKPKQGEVIATGMGKYDEEGHLQKLEVKVGDRVLFGAYAGTEVKSDHSEEELLILKEDEVLAIIQ
jgi:chaperonin GroES